MRPRANLGARTTWQCPGEFVRSLSHLRDYNRYLGWLAERDERAAPPLPKHHQRSSRFSLPIPLLLTLWAQACVLSIASKGHDFSFLLSGERKEVSNTIHRLEHRENKSSSSMEDGARGGVWSAMREAQIGAEECWISGWRKLAPSMECHDLVAGGRLERTTSSSRGRSRRRSSNTWTRRLKSTFCHAS